MTDGTKTTKGVIPFRHHPKGIDCPVKLRTERRITTKGREYVSVKINNLGLPYPCMTDGDQFIYVLPGGKEWVA